MKVSTIFLAFAVAVSAAPLPASAEILQGLRFVTAMKDNTLSGKTAAGTAYNVYFLPPAWRPIPMPRARVTTVAGSSTATATSACPGTAR
jgi:hypothetical protein